MWKLQGFSVLIMQQLPLHKREIGQAVPQDPSTAAHIFLFLLSAIQHRFKYCLLPCRRSILSKDEDVPLSHAE